MNVGFIGVGRMGGALLQRIKDLTSVGSVVAYDVEDNRVKKLGVESAGTAVDVASKSDVIFLCVKPKQIEDVATGIKEKAEGKLIVSIAAGVETKTIEEVLDGARVVRVMPNTPAVVGEMAAAIALGKSATEEDGKIVENLLSSMGTVVQVKEELMDAVTGLSGSGPAYVYYIIDALAKAGKKQGLSCEDALKLAAQTVKGAAEMILAGEGTPEELIERVKSPGGTTEKGMKVLEESNLVQVLEETVHTATEKSKGLSK